MQHARSALAFALITAAFVTACGARSEIREPSAGSGASGASSSSSATGAAGSGGAGGRPDLPCAALTQTGATITGVGIGPEVQELRPALIALDGGRASVAFGAQPLETPGPGVIRIAHAAFSPWSDWPATIGQAFRTANQGGDTFVAAPGRDGGIALLFNIDPPGAPSPDLFFAPAVLPDTEYAPLPDGAPLDAPFPSRPLFVARASAQHLAGIENEMGVFTQLALSFIDSSGLPTSVVPPSGCGASALAGDAIPSGDGYLLAFSSGRPFGTCFNDDGIPGLPNEIQVARWTAAGTLEQGAVLSGTDPIQALALVPRGDGGAWLVWHENGSTSLVPPPILTVRLDPAGQIASGAIELVPNGITSGPFAAAPLGDKLVFVWIDALDPSTPTLIAQVVQDDGTWASLGVPAEGWMTQDPIATLGAPSGDALILAWSSAVDAAGPQRLHAARIGCASAE